MSWRSCRRLNESATIGAVVAGVSAHVRCGRGRRRRIDRCDGGGRARGGRHGARARANEGKGHAFAPGCTTAEFRDVDYVLMLDGDLQHRPDEAPQFIAAAQRRMPIWSSESGNSNAARCRPRAITPTLSAARPCLRSRVCRCATRSAAIGCCGRRCCRRLRLRATGYDIETEMLIKVSRLGGRITSVPVTAVYGPGRSKLRPVRDTTRTCFRAVFYRYIERLP